MVVCEWPHFELLIIKQNSYLSCRNASSIGDDSGGDTTNMQCGLSRLSLVLNCMAGATIAWLVHFPGLNPNMPTMDAMGSKHIDSIKQLRGLIDCGFDIAAPDVVAGTVSLL